MIGSLSPFHWIIIIVAVMLLFGVGGRGKLSGLMGDAAKGIKAFREGLKEEDGHAPTATHPAPQPAQPAAQPAPLPRVDPVVEPEKVER